MTSFKLRAASGDSGCWDMDVVSFSAKYFVAYRYKTPTWADDVTPAAPSDSICWHTSQWSFVIFPRFTIAGLASDHHPGNSDFFAVLYSSHTPARALKWRIWFLSFFLNYTTAAELRRPSDVSLNNSVTFWYWSSQPQQRHHLVQRHMAYSSFPWEEVLLPHPTPCTRSLLCIFQDEKETEIVWRPRKLQRRGLTNNRQAEGSYNIMS